MSILQKVKQNKIQILVLLLIAVVHLAFISAKEGYHMDELVSFELANAEYNPWIVPTQPQGRLAKFVQEEIYGETFAETAGNFVDVVKDVLINRSSSKLLTYKADVYEEPVWIERATFEAYETTGQRDRFNLLSVYFNVKDDNHPPVHFMLLHLMCSLFPKQVSVWLGCLINVASLLGICILMMKGGTLLEKHGVVAAEIGQAWGICAALLYGVSSGAIATTLLIRMYGVMTFLCVWSLYLHVKKWLTGEFDKKNKLLIAVTVLGFLTQYFFLFYCILLAAVTFVLLIMFKRKKEAGIYVRSMVISAIIGVCLYPFAISHVFSSGRGVEALSNLGAGFLDFAERIRVFGSMVLAGCFSFTGCGVVFLIVGVLFLVRLLREKNFTQRWLVWMLLLPAIGYFLLAAKVSPIYVDRYVMAVFPFVLMAMAAVLVGIASKLGQFHMPVGVAVLAIAGIVAIFSYDGEYLYKGYNKQLALAKEHRQLPCICLYEGVGFYDNLPEFMQYEETLLVKPSELAERKNTSDLETLEEVVVLLKPAVNAAECLEILSRYGLDVRETLLEDSVYGDRIYLLGRGSKE